MNTVVESSLKGTHEGGFVRKEDIWGSLSSNSIEKVQLTTREKICNVALNIISFGIRWLYYQHRLQTALEKGNIKMATQAIRSGANVEGISLVNYRQATDEEIAANDGSIKDSKLKRSYVILNNPESRKFLSAQISFHTSQFGLNSRLAKMILLGRELVKVFQTTQMKLTTVISDFASANSGYLEPLFSRAPETIFFHYFKELSAQEATDLLPIFEEMIPHVIQPLRITQCVDPKDADYSIYPVATYTTEATPPSGILLYS